MHITPNRPTIALLFSQEHAYARKLCVGISEFARTHHWRILSTEIALGMPVEAYSGRIDGIIGLSHDRDLQNLAHKRKIPLVCFGTPFPDKIPDVYITPDHEAIVRKGMEYLLSLGLDHLAFFGYKENLSSGIRLREFLALASTKGVKAFMDWAHKERWKQNKEELSSWLASLPRPCGILVAEDRLAVELSLTLEDLGLQVPQEFSILSINDEPMTCEFCTTPVSSISLPMEEYGVMVAKMLQDLLGGKPAPEKPVRMPPKGVTVRQSTEILHLGDPIIEKAVLRIRRDAPGYPITVEELASDLPLTKRAFVGRFTKVMGLPPKAEIDRVRHEHAKNLLTNLTLSVKEIALSMGFETTNVFSRFFRRVAGQSPTEFRECL